MVGQVHPYKNVACEQRHLLGFPHERLWKSHTCCGLHKGPSSAPVQCDCTSPLRICVCRRARRKRGAVGVRAVSCWWEWDKNLFPLPKPSALSEASVFFYEATHTKTNTRTSADTHLQRFALKIEKVGAREDNSTGHRHFCARASTHRNLCSYLWPAGLSGAEIALIVLTHTPTKALALI